MNKIIKMRVYEKPWPDGFKVLIDRLWPRGIKSGSFDLWAKEIAPSEELRKWFNHDPEKWDGFRKKYVFELDSNTYTEQFLLKIKDMLKTQNIILFYGSKEKEYNNVTVLKEYIEQKIRS